MMEWITSLSSIKSWGNSWLGYAITVGLWILGIVILKLFSNVILSRVEKLFGEKINRIAHDLDRNILPLLYLAVFYFPLQRINLPEHIDNVVNDLSLLVFTIFVVKLLLNIAEVALRNYLYGDRYTTSSKRNTFLGLWKIAKFAIWITTAIFLLDNFGIKITPLVAGLGIGGAAVALAAQAILKDLFSSFAIYFDRPFTVGDFIVVDDLQGTVEYIGIKTTRIRSLSGEELVLSNSDLTSSRLHNYQRMERRRVVFSFNVTYDTPIEKLKAIPELMKTIINGTTHAEFARAHFAAFGDFALRFEIVYYVLGGDYTLYMDVQQAINLAMAEEFINQHIEFAYPTQTILLPNHGGR